MAEQIPSDPKPHVSTSHDPMRRMVLAALGGAFSAVAANVAGAQAAAARPKDGEEPEDVFNAYERQKTFDNNEMDGTPWQASRTGNFDLEDPYDNHLAKLKISANLTGARTYIPMLTRQLIAREQEPGGLVLGAASLFTWQLQEPDPQEFPGLPEGSSVMRSMFTSVYLDPKTMEPVKELKNPYNGTMMELEDYIFVENFLLFPRGGSRFVEELEFANDDPDKPRLVLIKKWGDDLILFNGGVYSQPGAHQPRFTENTWRSSAKAVMDPDVALVETNYNFLGINKAFEKPWAGYVETDKDNLCSLATGKKVHSAEDLPDFHKRVLVEKHPDRL